MTWFNASWPFRKKITVAQTQVDADLADFPVMVDLADADILAESRGDMRDVLFTAADGATKLSHELVKRRLVGSGGWTWFNNPHAIYHLGSYQRTYIGSIDGLGNLYVGQYTHTTGAVVWTQLTAALEVDDHDNPTLVVRPSDSKLVAFYTKHSADTSLRYKVSTNAEDATAWGSESTATFTGNITYANPIILPDDSNACYVFTRVVEASNDYNWSYKRTTDYSTWGSQVEIWDGGTTQSYLHFARNGNGRIDCFASDRHPDNNTGGSSLYHFYAAWDSGTSTLKWYNSAGTEQTLPMTPANATLVYDGSGGDDGWNHQIAIDGSGYPRVLFQKRVSTAGTGDMRLMFARWNGSAWTSPVEITALGGYVYSGEVSYTGGSCFDGSDIDTVYLGKQESSIYEIQAWATSDSGATWTKSRDITSGSASGMVNMRPFSPLGHPGRMACLWSSGIYTSYLNYNLSTFCDPPISTEAHVKVPTISGSTDTDIYVYYGNLGSVDQEDALNAWDGGYQAVYHMDFVPAKLTLPDSSGSVVATKKAYNEPSNSVYGAQKFDGVDDYITLGTAINMAGWTAATVESLINYDGAGNSGDEHQIFSNWATTNTAASMMLRIEPTAGSNALEGFVVRQTDTQIGGAFGITVTPNQINHVGMVFDSSNLRGYVNGSSGGTTHSSGGSAMDAGASPTAYIGNTPHGPMPVEVFGGSIYEIRISNVARSAAWMKASSVNLRTPSTFYTLGTEETDAGGTNTDSAAGSGSITVTGGAAVALRTYLGVAASGSITLTGSAANGVHNTLTNVTSAADAGSISLTGSAANAVRTFLTAAESGAISITGSAANGIYTPVGAIDSDAAAGSISITGAAALGRHDYLAAAGSGSITVTGSAASAIKSLGAVADSGSISITGSNALAIRTWLASADAGSITLTGYGAVGVKATPGTGTLDPATIAAIADAVWAHSSATALDTRMLICSRILRNRTITDPVSGIMTVYDDDNVTPYLTAQLYENVAETQTYRGQGAEVRARLT